MATEKAKTTATAKPETVAITKIYVGPTIPGVAIQNRVYSETPTGLFECFGKVPEMQNLMIPVSEYAEAERMIDNRKGYVYSAYLKALEYKENKGGN